MTKERSPSGKAPSTYWLDWATHEYRVRLENWNLKYDVFPNYTQWVAKVWADAPYGAEEAQALLAAAAAHRSNKYWNASYEQQRSTARDEREAYSRLQAVLLDLEGDELTGKWQAVPPKNLFKQGRLQLRLNKGKTMTKTQLRGKYRQTFGPGWHTNPDIYGDYCEGLQPNPAWLKSAGKKAGKWGKAGSKKAGEKYKEWAPKAKKAAKQLGQDAKYAARMASWKSDGAILDTEISSLKRCAKKLEVDVAGRAAYQKLQAKKKAWQGKKPQRKMVSNPPMQAQSAEALSNLLSRLWAMKWDYWTTHWQVSGPSFYGDHLLFERLYGKAIDKQIDALGERIVAYAGVKAIQPGRMQMVSAKIVQRWVMIPCPYSRALQAEREFQSAVKTAYGILKNNGDLSLGLDDFLMAAANKRDTALYLLQQRTRGAEPKRKSSGTTMTPLKGAELAEALGDIGDMAANPSARQRKKAKQWTVYHADHGIDPKQMAYIKKFLRKSAPQGFFIKQYRFPKSQGLGTVPNAMWGPASGDAAVPESQVHYMDRAGRGWEDRMIDRPPRPVNYGQVIGVRKGDSFTLFTVYGGPLAPQNAADPDNHDAAGSKKFWKQHALSSQQWAKANPRRRSNRNTGPGLEEGFSSSELTLMTTKQLSRPGEESDGRYGIVWGKGAAYQGKKSGTMVSWVHYPTRKAARTALSDAIDRKRAEEKRKRARRGKVTYQMNTSKAHIRRMEKAGLVRYRTKGGNTIWVTKKQAAAYKRMKKNAGSRKQESSPKRRENSTHSGFSASIDLHKDGLYYVDMFVYIEPDPVWSLGFVGPFDDIGSAEDYIDQTFRRLSARLYERSYPSGARRPVPKGQDILSQGQMDKAIMGEVAEYPYNLKKNGPTARSRRKKKKIDWPDRIEGTSYAVEENDSKVAVYEHVTTGVGNKRYLIELKGGKWVLTRESWVGEGDKPFYFSLTKLSQGTRNQMLAAMKSDILGRRANPKRRNGPFQKNMDYARGFQQGIEDFWKEGQSPGSATKTRRQVEQSRPGSSGDEYVEGYLAAVEQEVLSMDRPSYSESGEYIPPRTKSKKRGERRSEKERARTRTLRTLGEHSGGLSPRQVEELHGERWTRQWAIHGRRTPQFGEGSKREDRRRSRHEGKKEAQEEATHWSLDAHVRPGMNVDVFQAEHGSRDPADQYASRHRGDSVLVPLAIGVELTSVNKKDGLFTYKVKTGRGKRAKARVYTHPLTIVVPHDWYTSDERVDQTFLAKWGETPPYPIAWQHKKGAFGQ
jgi:hypothetical protein